MDVREDGVGGLGGSVCPLCFLILLFQPRGHVCSDVCVVAFNVGHRQESQTSLSDGDSLSLYWCVNVCLCVCVHMGGLSVGMCVVFH